MNRRQRGNFFSEHGATARSIHNQHFSFGILFWHLDAQLFDVRNGSF